MRKAWNGTLGAVKAFPSAFSAKLVLALAAIFLAVLVLLAHNLDQSYTTMKCGDTVQSVELTKGKLYRQNFKCQADGLEIISVQFFSQNPMQTKTSRLEVKLLSDAGGEIERWEVEAARIKNFNYYPFRLKHPIKNSNGKTYSLVITSNAEPETALVAATTSEGVYKIVS